MKEVRTPGLVRKHNNVQKSPKRTTRRKNKRKEKIYIERRGRTIEKDSISPPQRNLTKEVANLTKEMEENPRFSIPLSLSESRALTRYLLYPSKK